LTGGVRKTAFKLFYDVKYHELAPQLPQVKELNFDKTDIWLNVDNKGLILYTDNGTVNVNFDNYDELLEAIIRIGRELVFRDTLEALDQAYYDLKYYRRLPQLTMDINITGQMSDEIEKTKERVLKSNFKLIIRMGELHPKDIDAFIDSNPEVKRAVEDATEKYREMCWESDEYDDIDDCDKAIPVVDVNYYAIPEEKTIMITVDVDQIGEVYRVTQKYDSAHDFLKALDEYSNKVVRFW